MGLGSFFVSGTIVDLAEARHDVAELLRSFDISSACWEHGNIPYDIEGERELVPSAVARVGETDAMVLLVGDRFGTPQLIHGTMVTPTEAEYDQAKQLFIPVFAFVENHVHAAYARDSAPLLASGKGAQTNVPPLHKFIYLLETDPRSPRTLVHPFRDRRGLLDLVRSILGGLLIRYLRRAREKYDWGVAPVESEEGGSCANLQVTGAGCGQACSTMSDMLRKLGLMADVPAETFAAWCRKSGDIRDLLESAAIAPSALSRLPLAEYRRIEVDFAKTKILCDHARRQAGLVAPRPELERGGS